jgi:uncharacterized DUF497 family protein
MTVFEWDNAKAILNWRKHGITFETAQAIFDDPYAFTELDRIVGGEERWQTIGLIGATAILIVAHTIGGGPIERIRIISARRATRQERIRYEDNRQKDAW